MKIIKNISILMILLISLNFVIAQNYENGGVLKINFINQKFVVVFVNSNLNT